MAFDNVLLPAFAQFGSVAGPSFDTDIKVTSTGHEFRTQRSQQARHRLRLRQMMVDPSQALAVKAFGLARRGSGRAFPVEDFTDHSTAADGFSAPTAVDQILGSGDGSYAGPYQLLKVYEDAGPSEYVRALTLPQPGTVVAALDGVPTVAFTVNGQGQLQMAAPVPNGVVLTAGCKFWVPGRFEKSFEEFMGLNVESFDAWDIASLDIIEVKDEVHLPERHQTGGGKSWSVSSAVRLSLNDGVLQVFPVAVAIDAFLPQTTYVPAGSFIFCVVVPAGSLGSVQVRDDAGNAVGAAITAGNSRFVGLARSGANATWYLL